MTTFIPAITLPQQFFCEPAMAILLPVVLGTAVGFGIRPTQTQKTYLALKQPPLRPPPWVFGPMWTTLYALMGYAAYRAWTVGAGSINPRTVELTKQGATLYSIQLALNLLWMPLFFKYKRPVEATIDILALDAATAYLVYTWSQVDSLAGWALAPYLGWLGFATYLCIGTGHLNDWDLAGKERPVPPDNKNTDTEYVNEKPEGKDL